MRRELTKRDGLDRARTLAALAGCPVTLSDAEINDAIKRVYVPSFEQVLAVPREIALSQAEDAGDRLRAAQMVTDRLAGKVQERVDLTSKGKALAGVALVTDFPVAGGASPESDHTQEEPGA